MRLVSASRCLLLLALLSAHARLVVAQEPPGLTGLRPGLAFVENRGQWSEEVLFQARLGGGTVWLTRDALVFDFYEIEHAEREADVVPRREPEAVRRRGHVVAMRFEGGHARRAVGHGRQAAYHNYFLGNAPSRWASHVPLYDEVTLEGLYDGVDLRLYEDQGLLRYDLALAPGADLDQVRFRLEGADGVSVTEAGALRMGTALGPVEQRGLFAYQEGQGTRRAVLSSAFVVDTDGMVGFVAEGADPSRRLVIDPLVYSTFLGGSTWDLASDVAVEADGRATVAGETQSTDFPATPGAYDTAINGGYIDAFVARLSPDGSALEYATFLGGAEGSDSAFAVAVGADGAAAVVGHTWSSDFPTTPGAFDASFNGESDAFVVRFSPDGSALQYATLVGGSDRETASDLALGADGSATVVGDTESDDFPVTPGAFDTTFEGKYFYSPDAFVLRLSPDGSALEYATFLGGVQEDEAAGVALGVDGAATVVGFSESDSFPVTPGAYDTELISGDFCDAFVTRLSPDGSALVYSTFLGGSDYDEAFAVAQASDGTVAVVGHTWSFDFPTTPGAFDTSSDASHDHYEAFVVRLAADGSALAFSTFLGGTGDDDVAWDVALGPDGSVVAVGSTDSADFPTTPDGFDTSYNDSHDAFVARFSPDGRTLVYGSFLGGDQGDGADGVAVDADGVVTVAGSTWSGDFPVTPGAFDATLNAGYYDDAFVVRMGVGDIVAVEPAAEELPPAVVAPNPASDRATLVLTLERPSRVRVALYDVLGREVVAHNTGQLAAGAHRIPLDLSALPSGTYVWRLIVGEDAQPGRLTVVR